MISCCANPSCGVPFYYLRGGRLYRFDIKSPTLPCADVPNAICRLRPSAACVFFWLCKSCSSNFALKFDARSGLSVLRRSVPAEQPSDATVVAVEDSVEAESVSGFEDAADHLERPVRSNEDYARSDDISPERGE